MIKRLIIALVFSLFVYTREAYAVFDFVATLESQLEGVQKKFSGIQEKLKKVTDAYTRAKRGFDAVDGCIRKPKTCFAAIKELKSGLSKINMMSSVNLPEDKALLEVSSGEMVQELEKAVYVKGQGKDIEKTGEKKDEINAVVAADVASLWAKAVSTRQAILAENDDEQYNEALKGGSSGDEANMEKLLASQQMLSLLSARRVNRILELRSYMISAPATFVVMGHSVETEQNSGE